MDSAEEKIAGPFEFNFGKEVGTRWFDSAKAFSEFLNEERQRWQWVFELRANRNRIGNVCDLLMQRFSPLIQSTTSWQQVPPTDQNLNRSNRNNIQNLLNSSFGEGKLILVGSPTGKFINQIAESDKLVAACSLGFFLGTPMNPNFRESVEGAVLAIAFERGFQGVSEAERASISEQRDGHVAIVEAAKKLAFEQNERFIQAAVSWDKFITEFQERSSATESRIGDEWELLKKTFTEEIALRAPVAYWKDKAKEHSKKSWWALSAFVVVAAVFLVIIYLLVFYAWNLPARTAELSAGQSADLKHWEIGFLFLIITVGSWLLRIIMRLVLSHTHLSRDAEEKKISIETYLSLLESSAVPENQRQLVLQSIFRHAPSGLIRDDGMPPSFYEAITRAAK